MRTLIVDVPARRVTVDLDDLGASAPEDLSWVRGEVTASINDIPSANWIAQASGLLAVAAELGRAGEAGAVRSVP